MECVHTPAQKRNLAGSLERLSLRLRAQRVVALVTDAIRQIEVDGHKLDAIEDPRKSNLCHSAIVGMTGTQLVDKDLQEDLADLANAGPILHLP